MNMTGTLTTADGLEFVFDVMVQPDFGVPVSSFAITGGTIRDSLGMVTPVHPRLLSFNGLAKNSLPNPFQLKRLLAYWIVRGEI